eukprot:3226092-Ditylum_brightwellii.AAC.1
MENAKKATMKQGAGESTTKQKKKANFGTAIDFNMDKGEAVTSKQDKDDNILATQTESTAYDKEMEGADNGINEVWMEVMEAEEELGVEEQNVRGQETEHWTEEE